MERMFTRLVVLFAFMLFLFPLNSFAEKNVIIDPGHGGIFTSTCGYSGKQTGFCEKDANLLVALKLKDILASTDINVYLTRSTDIEFASFLQGPDGDFERRTTIANDFARGNNDNSIFITIHHNQDPNNSSTRGIETFYYDGVNHYNEQFPPDPMQLDFLQESKRLAEDVHPRLIKNLELRDRGIRNHQSFYVIRNAQMPAILVELGFMTNPEEEQLIKSDAFQQSAAQAIADGIFTYFKVFEVFDANHNKLETFTSKEDAINFAENFGEEVTVFDKDRQKIIFPEVLDRQKRPNRAFNILPVELIIAAYDLNSPGDINELLLVQNSLLEEKGNLDIDEILVENQPKGLLTSISNFTDSVLAKTVELARIIKSKILALDTADNIIILEGPFWRLFND